MISKSIVINKLKQKSGKAIHFYDVLYDFCCFFQNHEASCLKCRSLGSLEGPHGIMQDARGNGMDKKISIKVQVYFFVTIFHFLNKMFLPVCYQSLHVDF